LHGATTAEAVLDSVGLLFRFGSHLGSCRLKGRSHHD
jgi:hypothetical protein